MSSTPKIGDKIANFSRPATGEKNISLSELRGKNIVLYFYPRDSTPGCTTEGENFRDLHTEFSKLNTVILGVSRDTLKRHENFKNKYAFPFELLSDEDETLCRAFDVIKLKKLYGKESLGIERSTFLIDENGILRHEWRKVKVKEHASAVLQVVKSLNTPD